jgi:sugar lactone lactonase YvrE
MAATVSGTGAAGYGNASTSLLNPSLTGHSDALGAYVLSDINGFFSLNDTGSGPVSDYTCPSANTQVYLYALGGNPGAGTNNAASFLSALGSCGNLTSSQFFFVNEITTVAAAYSLSGFATDATHISIPQYSTGSTPDTLAQTGLQNAFATFNNLVNTSTGTGVTKTSAGTGHPNIDTLYVLANILASCINSNGAITGPSSPTTCYTLFNNALSGGSTGSAPTDTATAAINIAHHPYVSAAVSTNLFNLEAANGAPFASGHPYSPSNFSLAISYVGVLPANSFGGYGGPYSMAVDGSGNIWVADEYQSKITEVSNTGVPLSGTAAFTGGGLTNPYAIAIDTAGNVWASSFGNNTINEFSSTGVPLSGTGFTGGGLSQPFGIAIDGSGNVWTSSFKNSTLNKFSSAGVPLSATGFSGGGLNKPENIAIDGSGSVWVANPAPYSLSKFSNAGIAFSGTTGFTGGGLIYPNGIGIDATGNVWVANFTGTNNLGPQGPFGTTYLGNGISKFSTAGVPFSGSPFVPSGSADSIAFDGSGNAWNTGLAYGGIVELASSGTEITPATLGYFPNFPNNPLGTISSAPDTIAVDGSGNVWITSRSIMGLTELVGAATPVITPIAAGLPATPSADGSSNYGTRP